MPVAEIDAIEDSSVGLLREFERTGRPEPFEAFMRRHASMVYATCLKVTRDPHDAEDATQATFLTLASKSRLNGEIRQPDAWLRKVAHRLALDLIRSKKRRVNRESARSEMDGQAAPPDSHDRADAGEVKAILNQELAKLPAGYRMPLILHYFGGLSREEMAAQLKLKPSTLGVRLHRAREQLRRRLAGRGIALPAVALTALLSEVVRGAVCEHLMSQTAQQASAIALGHAAPAMFVSPAFAPIVSLEAGGQGAVSAIVHLLAHGKLRVVLSALVVSSAISLTSARVQQFLPASLRNALPTFRLAGLWPMLKPRFDFDLPTPTLRAQAIDPVESSGNAPLLAWVGRGMAREAMPLQTMPPAAPTAGTVMAMTAVASQARPNALPMAAFSSAEITRTFPASIATARASSPTIVAVSPRSQTPSRSATPRTIAEPTNADVPPPPTADVPRSEPRSEPRSDPWGGVVAARPGDEAGPAVPQAAASAGDENVPDRVIAPVTGTAPALSPGGGGGSGAMAGASDPPRRVDRGNSASPAAPLREPAASQTAVFTGTSANYGGFDDLAAKPTALTDLNGLIESILPQADALSFADGPAVPGETLSVNGARVTIHDPSGSGLIDVSFVDTAATDLPVLPGGHRFIGAWEVDSASSFASADLLVRYDDLRAARMGLSEQLLKLWVSDGTAWRLTWLDPSFGRDVNGNLLWVSVAGDFRFFAVSAPEPTVAGVFALAAIALRRRRRQS